MEKLVKMFFSGGSVATIALLTMSLSAGTIYAEVSPMSLSAESSVSAFRVYKEVAGVSISVPTVVEVSFGDEYLERFDFAVYNLNTQKFEPYYFKQETITNRVPIVITVVPQIPTVNSMIDENIRTYAEFPLPLQTIGQTIISLTSPKPITSSALTLVLDQNVALPLTIALGVTVDNQFKTVVAEKKMEGYTLNFPKTTASRWDISLRFAQPLRIAELRLVEENAVKTNLRSIRFLAQPGNNYRIYFDSDRAGNFSVTESGNLVGARDIVTVSAGSVTQNPYYKIADSDSDNVPDIIDNCVSVPNTDQVDVNRNNRGDVCDDFDQDGHLNQSDNCPSLPNRDQRDTDGDGIGDVCDTEESRITERLTWIPWAGMGFAGLVLVVLLALTLKHKTPDEPMTSSEEETPNTQ